MAGESQTITNDAPQTETRDVTVTANENVSVSTKADIGGTLADSTRKAGTPKPAPDTSKEDFLKLVPQEYRDKEYFKNFEKTDNPLAEILKSHESAQSQIGKLSHNTNLEFPTSNTPKEKVDAFFRNLGVPEEHSAYPDYTPRKYENEQHQTASDFLVASRPKEFMDAIKQAAHYYKLTPQQLNGMADAYDQIFVNHHANELNQLAAQMNERDADFEAHGKQFFGDRYGFVIDNGDKMMKSVIPDNLKAAIYPMLQEMPGKYLAAFCAIMDGFHKKYIAEGTINKQNVSTSGESREGIKKQILEKKAKLLSMNPKDAQWSILQNEIDALYRTVQT